MLSIIEFIFAVENGTENFMQQQPQVKKKRADSEMSFYGKRVSDVRQIAHLIFGDDSVMYIDVLREDRKFDVFIRNEKIDKSICPDKEKGKKRFAAKLTMCKLTFI